MKWVQCNRIELGEALLSDAKSAVCEISNYEYENLANLGTQCEQFLENTASRLCNQLCCNTQNS